jgi:hypothetical protein
MGTVITADVTECTRGNRLWVSNLSSERREYWWMVEERVSRIVERFVIPLVVGLEFQKKQRPAPHPAPPIGSRWAA